MDKWILLKFNNITTILHIVKSKKNKTNKKIKYKKEIIINKISFRF